MKKLLKRIAIVVGVLFVLFMVFVIWAVESDKKSDKTQETVQETVKQDYSHIVVPFNQESAPKLYEQWGEKWINDINDMMPKAINSVAQNPQCDEPVDIGLSTERSTTKENAVFYVDCKNKERFYVDQSQIDNGAKSELVNKSEEPALTASQKNAVRSAENYLDFKGFSRDGLIAQLSSEYGDGYSKEDATVAVDSLNVDWNEQAVKAAQAYLEFKGFSCKGLIQQLSSKHGDKFTKEQAEYGAKGAGACN